MIRANKSEKSSDISYGYRYCILIVFLPKAFFNISAQIFVYIFLPSESKIHQYKAGYMVEIIAFTKSSTYINESF